MADLHALEIEFAKNPSLEACIPLCEAYLTHKRFMEAMVVCKKGMKSNPQDIRGRILLGRIYWAQGKAPKAQQELEPLLREQPSNPRLLELMGRVYLDINRRDEGVLLLQQALTQNPSLTDARTWLAQIGVAPPAMAAPGTPAPASKPGVVPQAAPAPHQAVPGMASPPGAFGARGASPFAAGGIPGLPPPPGQPMPGVPQAATPTQPPETAAKPLEHVSDFFAADTLGFSNEASDIETAGPGRLTILGFVPKTTGSIKTTILIALGVFAVAGAIIFWQYRNSVEQREINKRYAELKIAMDDDGHARYRDVLRKGDEILLIDKNHNQTLSAMSYASAILGIEFRDSDGVTKARDYLARAVKSSNDETEYRVAARALLAYGDKQYEQGIADIKKVLDKGGSTALVELEAFRLMNAAKPGDRETQIQLRRLIQSAGPKARVFNVLGWYYYSINNWSDADKNFVQALQSTRNHSRAMLGQVLVDLDRGIALRERQKEIGDTIGKVFALHKDELGEPVLALAHFARAQLQQWQNKIPEAEEDYRIAFKLDPDNAMFYYRRGAQLLGLGKAGDAVEFLRKAVAKEPNNVMYYKTLANAQIKSSDVVGAKATLDRGAQLASEDKDFLLLEGDRLRASKQGNDAIATYKKIVRDDGPAIFSNAQMAISTVLRESGKPKEAINFMEKFLEQAPGIDPPLESQLWCELGLNYEAIRDKDAAIRWFETGIDKYTYNPDCHYYLCRVLGKGAEAAEQCKTYLALAPRGEFSADAKKRSGE